LRYRRPRHSDLSSISKPQALSATIRRQSLSAPTSSLAHPCHFAAPQTLDLSVNSGLRQAVRPADLWVHCLKRSCHAIWRIAPPGAFR
jgi:hypothetical protein